MKTDYDMINSGIGSQSGVLWHHLALSGKSILIMEAAVASGYSVAHDLHAPLRHIMGYVAVLQEDIGPSLSKENLQDLKAITRVTKRMKDLIDGLLSFARVGHGELHKTEVDLLVLVRETLGDFQNETKQRKIGWKIHPLPSVWGDYALLRMAVVNLMSNAVKFTRGRKDAEVEIGISPDERGETVVFVRDNGVGFDSKNADKLFGVFQRLHTDAEFEGTGVGLANVQRIIQRHGGRISDNLKAKVTTL